MKAIICEAYPGAGIASVSIALSKIVLKQKADMAILYLCERTSEIRAIETAFDIAGISKDNVGVFSLFEKKERDQWIDDKKEDNFGILLVAGSLNGSSRPMPTSMAPIASKCDLTMFVINPNDIMSKALIYSTYEVVSSGDLKLEKKSLALSGASIDIFKQKEQIDAEGEISTSCKIK